MFITVTLLLFGLIDYHYFTHPVKLPFRELANYVRTTRQENDYLINWNSSSHHLWETKYYGFDSPIYVVEGVELPFFVGTALMTTSDVVNNIPETASRVGVTTTGPIEEIEIEGYTETETEILGDLKFVWLTKQ